MWSIYMSNIFNISFCCIIKKINFNFNIFMIWKWFRKVFTNFYTMSFLSISSLLRSRPWNYIFNFFNYKSFFWPIRSISFSKNIFALRNSNMITNLKFRITFIWFFIVFNKKILCNGLILIVLWIVLLYLFTISSNTSK